MERQYRVEESKYSTRSVFKPQYRELGEWHYFHREEKFWNESNGREEMIPFPVHFDYMKDAESFIEEDKIKYETPEIIIHPIQ
jgi:hypothetical protein